LINKFQKPKKKKKSKSRESKERVSIDSEDAQLLEILKNKLKEIRKRGDVPKEEIKEQAVNSAITSVLKKKTT